MVGSARAQDSLPEAQRVPAQLQLWLRGLSIPVGLVAAPGDAARVYIVEKSGTVRPARIGPGGRAQLEQPILDVSDRITTWTEQGLLGLAFHPKFAENHKLYIDYTDKKGDTRIVEFQLKGDRVDPASERLILHIPQPYKNHNGGNLLFGPDGKLWIGTGDGGSHDDPHGNGQNRSALLAKMLLVDVDAAKPEPKIHMIGLRNPWRYTFDRATGDLYIADVGQDKFEEINVVPRDQALKGGQNFGWAIVEGLGHCHRPSSGCDQTGLVQPVVEYTHKVGCSVTGGAVYRGKAIPELDGVYFYTDYCSAFVRGFRWTAAGGVKDHLSYKTAFDPDYHLTQLTAFGEDAAGELYLLSFEGTIYKLVRR
jgi:glucose/arabinose dehydrogenase